MEESARSLHGQMGEYRPNPNDIVGAWRFKIGNISSRNPCRDCEAAFYKRQVNFADIASVNTGVRKCNSQPAGHSAGATTEIEDALWSCNSGQSDRMQNASQRRCAG